MSFESNVKLAIALSNPDLDPEELERETRNLLREIRDLDVGNAELVEVTEIPEGAKSVGGFLALLNQNMNHAIASSLRALHARSAQEPY
jgi:hypothetical protein